MKCIISFLSLLLLFSQCRTADINSSSAHDQHNSTSLVISDDAKIAFGSCNKQWEPQTYWNNIIAQNPKIWLWTGDIIYADTENMSEMKEMYSQQKSNPDYQKLLASTKVYGTWDDHDYGVNNGGKEYPQKSGSKDLLFDFLDVPAEHPGRNRPGSYQAYDEIIDGLKVKIVLLDARSFRDPRGTIGGEMLGSDQWRWLAQTLSTSDADAHLIVSGVQILQRLHPYEQWGEYPGEQRRLLSMLSALNVSNPILISGDRHIGEIAVDTLPDGRAICEITSSGLTHSYAELQSEPNPLRVGKLITDKNYGILAYDKPNSQIKAQIWSVENQLLEEYKVQLTLP